MPVTLRYFGFAGRHGGPSVTATRGERPGRSATRDAEYAAMETADAQSHQSHTSSFFRGLPDLVA